jgi:hypothetical protein
MWEVRGPLEIRRPIANSRPELFPGLLERMLGTASRRAHRGHEEATQREDRHARRLGEIDVGRIERRRKEVT